MARYDYTCTSCAAVFEVQHAPSETPLIGCPVCGGIAEKWLSSDALQSLIFSSQKAELPLSNHTEAACNTPGCAWHRPLEAWETAAKTDKPNG